MRHFGLCCFFVSQNAMQKLGIRLLPSIKATLLAAEAPSDFMAFSIAAMLRFLTPMGEQSRLGEGRPVFMGRLDDSPAPAQPYRTGEPPPPPPHALPVPPTATGPLPLRIPPNHPPNFPPNLPPLLSDSSTRQA